MSQSHVDPQPPGLAEVASRVREDIGMLKSALARERSGLEEKLRVQMEQHPIGTMLAAFGFGYLLAGGLFSRLTVPLLGASVRILASDVISRSLGDLDTSGERFPGNV